MKKVVIIGAILSAYATASGAESPDSLHAPHQLSVVEVLGLKTMLSPGNTPVTTINQAQINRLGINAVKDVGELVPNMYIPKYGSRMTSSIYMRGLGSRMDQSVVGLNVDGVPYLNKDAYDFDLPDIATISVSRGAQSVLNGRNAMVGQINVYTLSPRDWQGFRAMVEYGTANSAKVSLGGYFALSPSLFTSLTAYWQHTDGFWRNRYNNSKTGRENSGSARWKTVWAPSRALSVTNVAAINMDRQHGYPYAAVETGRIAYNDTCFYRRNSFSDGLTIAWAGERVVVTSLTSVSYLDDCLTLDQDFTPADYFTLTQARRELSVTQDLFTKGARGRYSWLGGVFGFYRNSRMHAPVTFFDTGLRELIEQRRNDMNPTYPISWDSRDFLLDSRFRSPNCGFALYHQSRWQNEEWAFEAGLRWDFERISCRYMSNADASYTTWHEGEVYMVTPVVIDDFGRLRQSFNQLLPKVSVARIFPWGRAYATFSKGYKAGGFNTQMFSDVLQQKVMETMGLTQQYRVDEIVSYRPETSWNYEAGIKTSWLNDQLTADAVLFFIDCHDQQLTRFPPGMVTGRIMTNAGRTYSRGLELSAAWRPADGLSASLSYGYTHATFHRYDDGRNDYSGKRLPYSPSHTLFASATWRVPLQWQGIRPVIGANLRGVGDIKWNESNDLTQPFYALLGMQISLESRLWSLNLWAENLTDTRYSTFYFTSIGNSFTQYAAPRTIGATLRLRLAK